MRHVIHHLSDDASVRLDGFIIDRSTEIDYLNIARPAVIVCPGGGYRYCSDREAEPVALKYTAAGFQTFVLRYTVGGTAAAALVDLGRAVKHVRDHAEEYNVLPDRLAVCGFSAGGHLAASLGVFWNDADLLATVGASGRELRPDMLILGYPVISTSWMENSDRYLQIAGEDESEACYRRLNLHLHVTADTPPTFLTHGTADPAVPVRDSLQFAAALEACDVPFEMHVFSHAQHGYSAADDTCYAHDAAPATVREWVPLSIAWLNRNVNGELDKSVQKARYSAHI